MITLGQEKTQYLQSRPLLMPNTQSLQKLFKIKLHMRQKCMFCKSVVLI